MGRKEQRKFTRTIFPGAAVLELGTRIVRGDSCTNISLGGIFIETVEPFSINEIGTITLTFQCDEKNICLHSGFRVIWCGHASGPHSPIGVGLKFKDIDDENQEKLETLLEWLIKNKKKLRVKV